VRLDGALVRRERLTVPMVGATALELEDAFGGGADTAATRPGAAGGAADPRTLLGHEADRAMLDDILDRVEALERAVARRERVFNRLLGLLAQDGRRR